MHPRSSRRKAGSAPRDQWPGRMRLLAAPRRQPVSCRTTMAPSPAFANPYMYWVGMDTDPRTTPEALAEFNHFYSTTHVGEVIAAHPGFLTANRYELLDPDPRGGVHCGPRWLAVYDMTYEAAADQYLKDDALP